MAAIAKTLSKPGCLGIGVGASVGVGPGAAGTGVSVGMLAETFAVLLRNCRVTVNNAVVCPGIVQQRQCGFCPLNPCFLDLFFISR